MSLNKPVYKLLDWIDENNLDWELLSSNPNAIELHNINWKLFSANLSIFELDYNKMK